jgi:hypothetical protein
MGESCTSSEMFGVHIFEVAFQTDAEQNIRMGEFGVTDSSKMTTMWFL